MTRARWPDSRLLDLLGLDIPLIQAPMSGFATAQLAAAVCAAGGLGSIACTASTPEGAEDQITRLRSLTDRPVNVNFFCHVQGDADAGRDRAWLDSVGPLFIDYGLPAPVALAPAPYATFGPEMCEVVEHARPQVVSFHFGLPPADLLSRVKAAGCRVLSSATTVEEAVWLEAHGVDAVIAQGAEAGGHRGMFLAGDLRAEVGAQPGTMALVPQVVDAVDLPVVAAGGIGDGRGIAAAFALGAAGAQLGTAYLRCPEAATSDLHRQALRHARADTTMVTDAFSGRPARGLVNRMVRFAQAAPGPTPAFPVPTATLAPLRRAAEQQGSGDFTAMWAGQSAALGREMPAGALTAALGAEALQCLGQLDPRSR